jgi:hypothetical protein
MQHAKSKRIIEAAIVIVCIFGARIIAFPSESQIYSREVVFVEQTEQYPVVVEKPFFDGANLFSAWIFMHMQIIEPQGLTDRRTWSFGGANLEDQDGLMSKEDIKSYEGQKIVYRFMNIDKYINAKNIVLPKYENKPFSFEKLKSQNVVVDMIHATR